MEVIGCDVDSTRDAAARVRTAREEAIEIHETVDASLQRCDADDWLRYKAAKRLINAASDIMEQARVAYADANRCWRSVEKATIAHQSHPLAALARETALLARTSANSDCNEVSKLVYEVTQRCRSVIKQLGEAYQR